MQKFRFLIPKAIFRSTHKRNGTVSLIASLAVHSGEVTGSIIEKNNSQNFLSFLKRLDRKYRNKH